MRIALGGSQNTGSPFKVFDREVLAFSICGRRVVHVAIISETSHGCRSVALRVGG